jgi:hypothetical protein
VDSLFSVFTGLQSIFAESIYPNTASHLAPANEPLAL